MQSHQKILTQEESDYSTSRAGDLVEEAVVDDAMDCVPPAWMSGACRQMGEPYSERMDPLTGKYRPTYATFRRISKGVWQYCGHCFQGETVERG